MILSYHNNPALKAKLLAEMKEHKKMDRIAKGGWFNDEEQKGCHIGCCGNVLGLPSGQPNFEEIAKKLGWPIWFA